MKYRIIARLTAYGAAGFGLGGAIGGAVWIAFEAPHLGFAILGAIGGASLGLALKGWRQAIVGAFTCAIGFDIGFLLPFFILLTVWEPANYVQGLFMGGTAGTLGGLALGLGMGEWKNGLALCPGRRYRLWPGCTGNLEHITRA